MQAVLVMFRSDGERRSFSVTRDMTVVGRREDSDLRIPLGDISRKHCRIVRDGETLRLEDLGSSNGTYHNGHRVEREAILAAGDSIQVGPVVFVLQIDGYPADDDVRPITVDNAATAYNASPAEAPSYPEEAEYAASEAEGLDGITMSEAEAVVDDGLILDDPEGLVIDDHVPVEEHAEAEDDLLPLDQLEGFEGLNLDSEQPNGHAHQ